MTIAISCTGPQVVEDSKHLNYVKGPSDLNTTRLIIFIHGVLGDANSTWTNNTTGAYWPRLIAEDDDLKEYDVATINYDTPLCTESSNIPEITTRVLERIANKHIFDRYEEIYFIAHSMGGLITKQLLVDLDQRNDIDTLQKIKGVFYLATPAQGAPGASLAMYFCKNPQVANMDRLHMNAWLQQLEKGWLRLIKKRDDAQRGVPKAYCAYEILRTASTSIVVPQEYATTRCDNEPYGIETNHINIVKPSNRDADSYDWVKGNLKKISLSLRTGQVARVLEVSSTYSIEETIWMIDLTTEVPIPPADRDRLFSKVTVERRDRLEKRSTKNEDFILYFGTSGNRIEWTGIVAPARQEFKELIPDKTFQTPLKHSFNYILHVGDKPAGFVSEIVNRFTFFNAFQGENEEWWSAELKYSTQKAIVFFAFPLDKPCKRITAYTKYSDENKVEIKDNIPIITASGKYAYWVGSNMKGASKIIFQWEW